MWSAIGGTRGFVTRHLAQAQRGVDVPISFQNEKRLPQGRLAVVSYVIVGMIALLLFGFWKLQIIDSGPLRANGRAQSRAVDSDHRASRLDARPRRPRPGGQLSLVQRAALA